MNQLVLLDYLVLVGYFLILIGIGIWTSRRIKTQGDFFMGGRSFGKLLQTFAAFGAGTGSSDPVNTGRTTFSNGMSGMWSVMYWLFVTPFYWITGVWYRRMRHLTLGDWFVERYESRALGAGYCVFGLLFFVFYGSMLFSAIGKVAAPLVGTDTVAIFGEAVKLEYVLVPIIGLVVLLYGILGGLEAAYFTDLIQGLCIIVLSIILIPLGLNALVEKFPSYGGQNALDGFRIMHGELSASKFDIVGTTSSSDFPWYNILAIVIINLIGIVVQPHFIATGGGSAKTEMNARVGLVVGNFLKRFCTIGWVLTALIAAALFADNEILMQDPDKTWGVASRELLGAGLKGLMLACLLAALMSSVDAYMVVGSALVVRNIYAPYINANATEKQYVKLARFTGVAIVVGAVLVSLLMMDVFEQLKLTWVFPVLFAAPFWVGMFWRRATTIAAWVTVTFCAVVFFGIPFFGPIAIPDLRDNPSYHTTNDIVRTISFDSAAKADLRRREKEIQQWMEKAEPKGPQPAPLKVGDPMRVVRVSGGQSIFWGDGVKPVDADGKVLKNVKPVPYGEAQFLDAKGNVVKTEPIENGKIPEITSDEVGKGSVRIRERYESSVRLQGMGNFKVDFLLYQVIGIDLRGMTTAVLSTLELPVKIVSPFLVMILISLITPRNSKQSLDRYYAKMKTPVVPDQEQDQRNLDELYADLPARQEELEQKKLFPHSSLEMQKPTGKDILGFVISFLVCFAIIGIAVWIANLQ